MYNILQESVTLGLNFHYLCTIFGYGTFSALLVKLW